MKYHLNIPDDRILLLNEEKLYQLLFLVLKEIEISEDINFYAFKNDLIRIIKLSNRIDLLNVLIDIENSDNKHDLISIMFPFFQNSFYNEKDFHFLNHNLNQINDQDIILKNNDFEKENPTFPLVIVLHQLRSAFNVGSIIRTAECFRIEKLIFSAYSPLPNHPKVLLTSMLTANKIEWEHTDSIFDTIDYYKNLNYTIYALETAEPSVNLFNHQFNKKSLIIVGNEALGIQKDILQKVDYILQIPVFGWKNSLNVGTATAIACYEVIKQYSKMN